jgi:hypothetical protein
MALQHHPALEMLSLRDNHLGQTGAEYLAEMIAVNHVIKYIDLSNNTIGDFGAIAFASSLAQSKSLESLNLENNNINESAATDLASAMSTSDQSLFISLKNNREGCPASLGSSSMGSQGTRSNFKKGFFNMMPNARETLTPAVQASYKKNHRSSMMPETTSREVNHHHNLDEVGFDHSDSLPTYHSYAESLPVTRTNSELLPE